MMAQACFPSLLTPWRRQLSQNFNGHYSAPSGRHLKSFTHGCPALVIAKSLVSAVKSFLHLSLSSVGALLPATGLTFSLVFCPHGQPYVIRGWQAGSLGKLPLTLDGCVNQVKVQRPA